MELVFATSFRQWLLPQLRLGQTPLSWRFIMLPSRQRAMENRRCFPVILWTWLNASDAWLRRLAARCSICKRWRTFELSLTGMTRSLFAVYRRRNQPRQMVGRGLPSLKPTTVQRLICPAGGTNSPYHFTCWPAGFLPPGRHFKPSGRARFTNFLSGAERALQISSLAGVLVFLVQPAPARQRGADASFDRAVQALNAGKLDDAKRFADAAQEANPERPDIRNLRGA